MSSSVDLIKEKLEVSDVLGSYLKLEKAGGNFKGKCPFHNEKTPSFFVSPDRGTYYCFGCGAKGDIFTFVQEFEGVDFRGALKMLAARAGVPLEFEQPKERSEKDRLFSALEQAAFFFQKNLAETPEAKRYLENRGLTDETIREWGIGYALLDWQKLHDFLLSKGFTKDELERVGLIKKSEKRPGEHYDVFRGRVMFPIFDTAGRVIAFSGRILVDDGKSAKYINTSETVLFNKSETLYGLHKAKTDIRRKDYSILVEGQMDLVMAHQAGFGNTIASSGTAFTAQHLEKLKRLSNRITLAFDADGAGFAAANKSAQLALSLGMEVKVALLPKGSDPAELIKTNPGAWTNALKSSTHIIDFYLQSLLARKLDPRSMGKEIQRAILPYINMLESNIERAHFVSRVASQAGIKEESVWDDVKKLSKQSAVSSTGAVGAVAVGGPTEAYVRQSSPGWRKHFLEKRILGIRLWQEGAPSPQINPDDILNRLAAIVGKEETARLQAEAEREAGELIFEVEAYYGTNNTLAQDLDELFSSLEDERLKDQFAKAMAALHTAERDKDAAKVEELLAQCQELSKKIAARAKKT
jgi:DNA primase